MEIFAREPFICREGWTFLAADFCQIELRLLAHLSGEPAMLQLFKNTNSTDVFMELTSQWLGKSMETIEPCDREQTKRVVYSIMYGVGKEKLAEYLHLPLDEVRAIMTSFLVRFPGVNSLTKSCMEQARKNGYQATIFKRRRYFPNINHPSLPLRAQSERQAFNFCVQGSAADLCKAAMVQVEHALASQEHLCARLLVQIHDELLLEVKDEYLEKVAIMVKQIMESSSGLCGEMVLLKVPLMVSLSVGKSWAHLEDYCIPASSK